MTTTALEPEVISSLVDDLRRTLKKERSAREINTLDDARAFDTRVFEQLRGRDLEEHAQVEMMFPWNYSFKFQKKRIPWQEVVGAVVAAAYNCRYLAVQGSNLAYFIGEPQQRLLALYVYGFLVREIAEQASTRYEQVFYRARQKGNLEVVRGWRASFLNGVLDALVEHFQVRDEVVNDLLAPISHGMRNEHQHAAETEGAEFGEKLHTYAMLDTREGPERLPAQPMALSER